MDIKTFIFANKKLIALLVLAIIIYYLYTKTSKKMDNTTGTVLPPSQGGGNLDTLKYTPEQKAKVLNAAKALVAVGAPKDKLSWMLAQIAHETGNYTNVGSKTDNNLSGIKFFNAKIQNATAGSHAPSNEGKTPYAHYANYNDWAKDYLRILTRVGKARPLEATTIEDFAHRLGLNGYYGLQNNGENIYKNSLKYFEPKFREIAKTV